MRHRVIVAFACLGVVTTAAFATTPASEVAAEQKAEADQNPIVCRRIPVTGSLVQASRVCRRRADWDRERVNARRAGECAAGRGGGGAC